MEPTPAGVPVPSRCSRFRGCLLGGALGDALGAPVEFLSLQQIRSRYGEHGIADLDTAYGRRGAITDDTQMTLFTAEGILRAFVRARDEGRCHLPGVVHHAYLRWLHTQGVRSEHPHFDPARFDGRLIGEKALYARRAPGNACLSGLQAARMGTREEPVNANSKGCGTVMRIAPAGLMPFPPEQIFDHACEIAALTHGHPSGYLAAGFLAHFIALLCRERSLEEAFSESVAVLRRKEHAGEVLAAVEQARELAASAAPSPAAVARLGEGWVAEEALAIALYCTFTCRDDFARGVRLAVNHSGDSDSTGAITGNLLGLLLGEAALPAAWLETLELRETITRLADDLCALADEDAPIPRDRYPGW